MINAVRLGVCVVASLCRPDRVRDKGVWKKRVATATQSACLTCSPMWEWAKQERELLYVSVSQNPVGLLERITCLCCGQPTWADREGSAGPDHSMSCLKPLVIYLSLSPPELFVCASSHCLSRCSFLPSAFFPIPHSSSATASLVQLWLWGVAAGMGGGDKQRQREGGRRRTDRRCRLCFPQDIADTRAEPKTQTVAEIYSNTHRSCSWVRLENTTYSSARTTAKQK